jgi:hypothetical protein
MPADQWRPHRVEGPYVPCLPLCVPCLKGGVQTFAYYLAPSSKDKGQTIDEWTTVCGQHRDDWWKGSDWFGNVLMLI